MSKTNFVNGTIVTPTFLNAVQEHVHDGAASDGHAPKVTLTAAADVTGLLPSANVDNDSNVSGADLTAALNSLLVNTGTITEGNFDAVFVGSPTGGHCFTAEKTINIKYRLWQSGVAGVPKIVTLMVPALTGTSSSNRMCALNCLPSAIRPATNLYVSIPISVIDNSVSVLACIRIQNYNSALDFPVAKVSGSNIVSDPSQPTGPDAGYTASGTKGFEAFTVSYTIP